MFSLLNATDLTICFTGNNRGLLSPCGCTIPAGGYPRISTEIKNIKGNILLAGVGNHLFHHSPMKNENQIFEQKKAFLQAELMAELKYQVVNVGQFDLCYGIKPLLQIQNLYGLDFISANLTDLNGVHPFPSHKVINYRGMDIMFIGLCYLSDALNYRINDPIHSLEKLDNEGLFEEADLVILLADVTSKKLADFVKEHNGIDLIVAAKEHKYTHLPLPYKTTSLVQLGSQGKYLGKLNLTFNSSIKYWKDLSIYNFYVEEARLALNNNTESKNKRKKLKRHRNKLKKEMKSNPNHFTWDMTFLDELITDDLKIKNKIEKLLNLKKE